MKINNISIKYSYIILLFFAVTPLYFGFAWYNHEITKTEIISRAEFAIAQSKSNLKNSISLTEYNYELISETYHGLMTFALEEFKADYEKNGGINLVDINQLKHKYNNKLDFYVIDKKGVIVRSTFAPALGIDFGKIPEFFAYIEDVRTGNKVVISKVTTDLKTKELRKWGYIPTGDQEWVLEVGLNANELSQYISKIDYPGLEQELKRLNPYISSLRVFDWNKIPLGYPDEEISDATISFISDLLDKKKDHRAFDEDGLPLIDHFYMHSFSDELGDTAKIIKITYNTEYINSALGELTQRSLFGFVVFTLVTFIVIYFATKNFITVPVIRLSKAITKFEESRKKIRIPVTGNNEISSLIRSFNSLSEKLVDSTISRNKFENILDSVGDIVIIVDLDLIITQVNRHGRKELAVSESAYNSAHISSVLCPNEDSRMLQEELEKKNVVKEREVCFVRSDSSNIPTLATFSKIYNTDGNVIGYICNAKNISNTRQKLQKLSKENEELHSKGAVLEERTRKDFLTKLHNRYHIEEALKKAVEEGQQSDKSFFVLMLDIDKFKDINDTYGHQIGDRVLVDISEVISSSIRSEDVSSRYGGEEFLVLLTHTSKKGARIISNRIRQNIEQMQFSAEDETFTVTISGGLAGWDDDSVEEIVSRADKCLYKAKNGGRNRIECDFDPC